MACWFGAGRRIGECLRWRVCDRRCIGLSAGRCIGLSAGRRVGDRWGVGLSVSRRISLGARRCIVSVFVGVLVIVGVLV